MITITGKNGIKATVLAYSISAAGKKMITWEIEYPRLILAELNTHRQLSRNSFSSRAVPFLKMIEQLQGEPVRFGANQAGMQDKGQDYDNLVDMGPAASLHRPFLMRPKQAWGQAKAIAIVLAEAFFKAGYHKQVYNRLLEPFQMMKTVLSATEVDNFFWLRDDEHADPTLHELARVMREAMEANTPELLQPGEWHLPYIDIGRNAAGVRSYFIVPEGTELAQVLTLDEAIKVSCARCAAVSYRNEGYGLAKSLEIYEALVGGDRKHASAFEHQATPIQNTSFRDRCSPANWPIGVSHMDRDYHLWSGNLCGWIQYRKLIPNECYINKA